METAGSERKDGVPPSMSSKSTPKKGSRLSLNSLKGYCSLTTDKESAGVLALLTGDVKLLAVWEKGDRLLVAEEVVVKEAVAGTCSRAPQSAADHGPSLLCFLSTRQGWMKIEDDIVFKYRGGVSG